MSTRTFRLQGEPLLDLASYARRGPGRRDRLSPEQVKHIERTVRRVPEVMVKVSGGGTSAQAVAAHFKYINRRGQLEVETDEGTALAGRGAERELVEDWDLESAAAEAISPYGGRPGRRPAKLVHNIILSMPAQTPPEKLLAASRDLAREQFALKYRYAMVLHTDQDHPHVHLVVKALSEQGERLNIRKVTLREWRREFARHLREHGVEANATERAVRGGTRTPKIDGLYRAEQRSASHRMRERTLAIAQELVSGQTRAEPGRSTLLQTRRDVRSGWLGASDILVRQGHADLAEHVRRFVVQMPPPRTDRDQIAQVLLNRVRDPKVRAGP